MTKIICPHCGKEIELVTAKIVTKPKPKKPVQKKKSAAKKKVKK